MKRRVAIYARVSTEHEAQLSALDNQIQDYDELLKQHPDWELYNRYIDEGITGTSVKKRKNFMRMLEDAERGYFDLIITREVSRFARNTVDTLQVTRNLKKIGVEVFFKEDNIWTFNDEDGELKLTIMATLAQNESRKTSQRVKAGMKISMLNGVFYGTGNIMGYDKVGKEMVVNEEQAKVVKLIYKLFLEGNGVQKIKYELERRGILTSAGNRNWHAEVISNILHNSFYAGTIVYKKELSNDYLEQKRVKNKGQVEQIVVEGTHTPIISKEDFEEAQKIFKKRSINIKNTNKLQMIYPAQKIWSKKLVCECGSHFNRRVSKKNSDGHIVYSYQCYNQKNNGSGKIREKNGLNSEGYCDIPAVCEWKLEVMGTVLFNKMLFDNEILDCANSILDEEMTNIEENDEITDTINSYRKKVNKNNDKLKKLLDSYLEGIIEHEQFIDMQDNIKKETENLEKEIKGLETKIINTTKIDLKDYIKKLKNKISKKADYNYGLNEDLLDLHIEKIIVHKDHFDWKLNSSSDIIKKDDELANNNGKFLTRIIVSYDDIVEVNNKRHLLKRIKQKEPLIMDIYI